MSFIRPVMCSWPWAKKPRSPVRRYGPSPVSASRAANVCSCFDGATPIAHGVARAAHPNFADLAGGDRHASFGIDNRHLLAESGLAAADEALRSAFGVEIDLRAWAFVAGERVAVNFFE